MLLSTQPMDTPSDSVAKTIPAGYFDVDGLRFRDLDHDAKLAPYEDWRLTHAERAVDLASRMTLAEKVGLMVHGTAPAVGSELASIGIGTGYDLDALTHLIHDNCVNSLISRLSLAPAELAAQNNAVQTLAAAGRLGIPVTISTDPRHHFNPTLGAAVSSNGFSQWPGTLGLAAIGDQELVRRFGDIVRQEYRAVGLHMALSRRRIWRRHHVGRAPMAPSAKTPGLCDRW